jgi:hypothetical protein
VEARLTIVTELLLCLLAALAVLFPRALAYPAGALAIWGGLVLLVRGVRLCRRPRGQAAPAAGGRHLGGAKPPEPAPRGGSSAGGGIGAGG